MKFTNHIELVDSGLDKEEAGEFGGKGSYKNEKVHNLVKDVPDHSKED